MKTIYKYSIAIIFTFSFNHVFGQSTGIFSIKELQTLHIKSDSEQETMLTLKGFEYGELNGECKNAFWFPNKQNPQRIVSICENGSETIYLVKNKSEYAELLKQCNLMKLKVLKSDLGKKYIFQSEGLILIFKSSENINSIGVVFKFIYDLNKTSYDN
jgi:hypothetical protein